MTELTEGDKMALLSQWVELQESAREWLRSDTKQEMTRSRYGSGDVSCTSDEPVAGK